MICSRCSTGDARREPGPAHAGWMGIGDHPQRTPAYGALLIVSAMVASTLVTENPVPTWARIVCYSASFVAACAGLVMTLRDRTW